MAAEVVDAAGEQLAPPPGPSTTHDRPMAGAQGLDGYAAVNALADELAKGGVVDAQVAKHLASTYGVRARAVVARIAADRTLGDRLDPELPFVVAQVDTAVLDEQALAVDDVLDRRVPLLLRARDQGIACTERVAKRMQTLLGWTEARTAAEIEHYRAVVDRTRLFRRT